MRTLRLVQIAIIGGIGGLFGWVCLQFLLFLQLRVGVLPYIDLFVYKGLALSLGIGAFIFSKEAILGNNFSLLPKNILLGACFGMISGFLGFLIGQTLLGFSLPIPLWSVRVISWALMGLWLGIFINLRTPTKSIDTSILLGATIGGGLGGYVFEVFQMLQNEYIANLLGLIFLGMILSVSMSVINIWPVKSYLRVLTGTNEGKIYLLDKNLFTLGYLPKNDIVLNGYSEVCQTHAHLTKSGGNFQITNVCIGGQVFVNYRFVEQQDMKNGDIIKLGNALLQYYEVS